MKVINRSKLRNAINNYRDDLFETTKKHPFLCYRGATSLKFKDDPKVYLSVMFGATFSFLLTVLTPTLIVFSLLMLLTSCFAGEFVLPQIYSLTVVLACNMYVHYKMQAEIVNPIWKKHKPIITSLLCEMDERDKKLINMAKKTVLDYDKEVSSSIFRQMNLFNIKFSPIYGLKDPINKLEKIVNFKKSYMKKENVFNKLVIKHKDKIDKDLELPDINEVLLEIKDSCDKNLIYKSLVKVLSFNKSIYNLVVVYFTTFLFIASFLCMMKFSIILGIITLMLSVFIIKEISIFEYKISRDIMKCWLLKNRRSLLNAFAATLHFKQTSDIIECLYRNKIDKHIEIGYKRISKIIEELNEKLYLDTKENISAKEFDNKYGKYQQKKDGNCSIRDVDCQIQDVQKHVVIWFMDTTLECNQYRAKNNNPSKGLPKEFFPKSIKLKEEFFYPDTDNLASIVVEEISNNMISEIREIAQYYGTEAWVRIGEDYVEHCMDGGQYLI